MASNQSAKNLVAVTLIVAALFVAVSYSIHSAATLDWWLPLALLVLGVAIVAWDWYEARMGARAASPAVPPAQAQSHTPDDLTRIEGIGPKIAAALNAAGIASFEQLASASENQLRAALEAKGLRFAPSLSTWHTQAGYLARGDAAGFEAYVKTLVAGRKG